MKKQFLKKSLAFALATLLAVGCSKDGTPDQTDQDENLEGQFLVAVSSGTTTYLIPTESLEDENASITTVGNGYEYDNTFSHYLSNGYEGFVAIKYGQGGAHVGQRFTINSSGTATVLGGQFELLNGFITAGIVGDNAYTLMSGGRAADPTTATLNRITMSEGIPQFAYFKVNEFQGYEGKNGWLIGLVDAGDGSFYTGVDLTAEGVDDVVIAKISSNSLVTQAVYSDTRLSKSGGQMQSARYSQIGKAANGDLYVFSGNYAGTKKAGALVIRSGASDFDQDYFWDIEAASGGYRFRKVWPVKDDIFLLEFYNDVFEANVSASGNATQYAVVDMSEKKFTWVSGLPSKADIPNQGVKWPYVFDGKVYIGVRTSVEAPRFYVLNPETGIATKGLLVNSAEAIESVTFVEKN